MIGSRIVDERHDIDLKQISADLGRIDRQANEIHREIAEVNRLYDEMDAEADRIQAELDRLRDQWEMDRIHAKVCSERHWICTAQLRQSVRELIERHYHRWQAKHFPRPGENPFRTVEANQRFANTVPR
jgi:hypothetical protein